MALFPRTWELYTLNRDEKMWMNNYGNLATFSCKHKVTQKSICAIPCDGVEELCENNIDEQCQGPGLLVTLVVTIVLSATFIAIASAVSFYKVKKQNPLSPIKAFQGNGNLNENMGLKEDNHFIYLKLSVYKTKMEITNCIEIATFYSEKDAYIKNILGTNDLSAYFYDCMERSIAVKIHIWLYNKIPKLFIAMRNLYVGALIIIIKSTVTLCLKYLDLTKDILFLYILWLQLGHYTTGSFPMAVFYILAVSLGTTEVGNFCIIITQNPFADNWAKKMLLLLLAPLLPAYNIYVVLHCEFSKFIILNHYDLTKGCHTSINKEIHKLDAKIWSYQLRLAKLQYNENLSENLSQLTMLLLITLLNNTSSGIVNNLQNIFIDERSFLGWVLAGMSLVSLIRGQLSFLAGIKNGCQTGTILLASYFLIGIASR